MKNKTILTKTAVISCIMAIVAMILNGVVLFALFWNNAKTELDNSLRNEMFTIDYEIVSYESSEWIANYWRENWQEMDLLIYHRKSGEEIEK